MVPTYKDIIEVIQKDLIDEVVSGKIKEATTQTAEASSRESVHQHNTTESFEDEYDDPLRIGRPRLPRDPGFPDIDRLVFVHIAFIKLIIL